jgi:hypothetical protein
MRKILSVAHNTFIEAIRDRVLYSLILFAIIMILSSLVFASISAEQYNKIVKDLGLTAISVIGILISVFLGIGLVYKEVERKTVYNIFSKPIKRYEFIFGKYLGLGFTLFVITLGMGLILFLLVLFIEIRYEGLISFYYGGHYYAEFFNAVYFEYLEFLVVIGIALVFSSFTTPVLSALFTFFAIAIGRFSSDVRLFAEEVKSHPESRKIRREERSRVRRRSQPRPDFIHDRICSHIYARPPHTVHSHIREERVQITDVSECREEAPDSTRLTGRTRGGIDTFPDKDRRYEGQVPVRGREPVSVVFVPEEALARL